MTRRPAAVRALLAWLALSCAVPGAWAVVAPHAFFASFPGAGHWVARLPAENPHLTTDVGGFYLAFAALFAWAAVRPDRALVVPLCAAWAAFSVLHLAWHAAHLQAFDALNAGAQLVSLAVVLAAPAAVLWLSGGPARQTGSASAP